MVSKIISQFNALSGQNGNEALLRNEKASQNNADRSTLSKRPEKKLDASYELNLSEAAQGKVASPLPAVNTPEDARRQLELIKSAAENSAANLTSLHKVNAKSVVDLLA